MKLLERRKEEICNCQVFHSLAGEYQTDGADNTGTLIINAHVLYLRDLLSRSL